MRGHLQDAGGVGDHGGGLREGGSGGPGEPHHLHLRAQDPALSRDGQPGRRGESQDVRNCSARSPVCFSWEVTAECDKCARCINIEFCVAMIGRELVRVDMASRNNFDKVCRAKLAEKFN